MSDPSRSLPERPSLRYLKLEARRRLAAGEFPTLHEAQLAIAREHGMSSWTALKEFVGDSQPELEGAALSHVRWVASRFAGAGQPGWSPPGGEELGEHFEDSFLSRVTPAGLVSNLSSLARGGGLRDDVTVLLDRPLVTRAQAGDVQIQAGATAEPPHRLRGMRAHRVGEAITDTRLASPPADVAGDVPVAAVAVAEEVFTELGLPALVLASGDSDGRTWELARGWADLDRGEPLTTTHRFPAYALTTLITATAVLRLIASRRLNLDEAANAQLRTIRLADDAVTVRDLLAHADGIAGPTPALAETVPDLAGLTGPVLASTGARGTAAGGLGGYAALEALIANVTGQPYPDAVARLVLDPLRMGSSWFPQRWPADGTPVVTGYQLNEEGGFRPAPAQVGTVRAATGLWTTAADLLRFGLGWSSLLPDELASEALRPQTAPLDGRAATWGLGWRVNQTLGVAGHAGLGRGVAISLVMRLDSRRIHVAMTNRGIPIEPVIGRVIRAIAHDRRRES
jgi:CubicO group peptidase (beta-lactamase class C family)